MKDDRLYLIHLSESIAKIESYIGGLDFASLGQTGKTRYNPAKGWKL